MAVNWASGPVCLPRPMRRRRVDVRGTPSAGQNAGRALGVTTFNVWFDPTHAARRYRAIVDLLAADPPDVAVFQEVTPGALPVFLDASWVHRDYGHAAVVGRGRGNYGMLLLSRLPLGAVRYTALPTRLCRGFLTAEVTAGGRRLTICSLHLESGKAAARLRRRQLGDVFAELRHTENALILGDFNMRDRENDAIGDPYVDLWPALRPGEPGFTEDTDVNHMRFDSKPKHRQVRFDRILLKGDDWRPTDIGLLGTAPVGPDLPRVFPSDHFGLSARFEPAVAPGGPDATPGLPAHDDGAAT